MNFFSTWKGKMWGGESVFGFAKFGHNLCHRGRHGGLTFFCVFLLIHLSRTYVLGMKIHRYMLSCSGWSKNGLGYRGKQKYAMSLELNADYHSTFHLLSYYIFHSILITCKTKNITEKLNVSFLCMFSVSLICTIVSKMIPAGLEFYFLPTCMHYT